MTDAKTKTMELLKIRERVRAALAALADRETEIESGFFLGTVEFAPYAELFIVIGGCEYSIQISKTGDDDE
jgi:hypothetical protein